MLLNSEYTTNLILDQGIVPEWVEDHHLSRIGFTHIFMKAEREFFERVEIDEAYRADTGWSAYVVESHNSYLRPVPGDGLLSVSSQILDLTNKALHVIFLMRHVGGATVASRECLYLHGGLESDRLKQHPFGRYQLSNLVRNFERDKKLARPDIACRGIGIRRHNQI